MAVQPFPLVDRASLGIISKSLKMAILSQTPQMHVQVSDTLFFQIYQIPALLGPNH